MVCFGSLRIHSSFLPATSGPHRLTLGSKSKGRVSPGDCHYFAGSLARYSELHLLTKGTRTVIGTCGLEKGHMMKLKPNYEGGSWVAGITEMARLKNGLCVFSTGAETQALKLIN